MSEAKEREPDVVFIGDSLIYHLQHSETWRRCFAPLHALNFGIGGDQAQHVLWRVTNGEMDSFCPKVRAREEGRRRAVATTALVGCGAK